MRFIDSPASDEVVGNAGFPGYSRASMPGSDPSFAERPVLHVSVTYLVMVAVAMVVGAGIFKSPSIVAASTGSFEGLMAAWITGGMISMAGALCYAELATAFPSAGGDYHFLKTAYCRNLAFLFA